MKSFLFFIVILSVAFGCKTSHIVSSEDNAITNTKSQDTVRIANEDLEYEIIIIEPGFQSWLVSTARPKGYHSQTYLENRNIIYVTEWNSRCLQPMRYSRDLYELPIDYSPNIDYGYDVNYQLYNYFIFFQLKYKQQLGPRIPRI